MFTRKDVAAYYNSTQNHYESWWNLKQHLALHYGIWDEHTRSFTDSVINTNKLLLEAAEITATDKVLDAGCGVGGSAFYIHATTQAKVTGISLSEKQIALANTVSAQRELAEMVDFHVMDYTTTPFADESFDVIWACESICHTANKTDFMQEAYRLLKKGGRLILCDYFLTADDQQDPNQWIEKWKATWAITHINALSTFETQLENSGFKINAKWDYTEHITRSAKRMYQAALLGAIPSELYNLFNPSVSRFAKTHYKCGYYQYKALKQNLWQYHMILAEKSELI